MRDIEFWAERKRNLMRILAKTKTQGLRRFWAERVNRCDESIGLLLSVKRAFKKVLILVVAVNILVVASIILTGCLEHTIHGAGKMVQGTGQFVQGVGLDMQRSADGYGKQ